MRVSLKIPYPAAMKVGKEDYHLLKAGTELHRVHLDAFGSTEFNGTDKGNARFSPIRNDGGGIIPTIYAAQSFECAACEIILRCPDTPPRTRTTVAPPEFAVLLFGDRVPDDILDGLSKRDIADPICHDEIQKLAASLSIDYEDV